MENAELVLLRIEALLEGNGIDLAQRLINRFVKVKGNDVRLMSMLLILLHNADQCDEFHRQASQVVHLSPGVQLYENYGNDVF